MNILPQNLLLPQRTVSGAGSIHNLESIAAGFGTKGVLVHGRSLERSGVVKSIVSACGTDLRIRCYCHEGSEPTVHEVDTLRNAVRESGAEWVAAIGGGSVIDLAKAAAGLADHTLSTAFYQVNPSEIQPASIPLIAAPTTAGTGSEATVVSVLTNPDKGLKQSIRHASHMPKAVILDPKLLDSCPPVTIAAAGLDAFIQAFESYTSRHAVPFTQSLAECAIERIAANLLPLYENPSDIDAATAMLEASYITGLAFSHSRLGVIHGLAHPLGVRFKAAHGAACACSLPAALEYNQDYIQGHLETLKSRCKVDVNELVESWMQKMQLDNPFTGKSIEDMDAVVREVLNSGSTKANPREVTAEDVLWLVGRILEDPRHKCRY